MLPEHENVGTVLLDIGMFLNSIGWLSGSETAR
jgi:hypothetical protein